MARVSSIKHRGVEMSNSKYTKKDYMLFAILLGQIGIIYLLLNRGICG